MKKFYLLFLMALLPLVTNAETVEINGIYYNLISKGNVAEVTLNPNKYSGNIVIPISITYNEIDYNVIGIGEKAFEDCNNLTSITIGNKVTRIGNHAFNRCTFLSSVTIPSSVTVIGEYAFSYCWNISTIDIPNSVKTIGEGAFFHCGITSIIIPNNVTTIAKFTFYDCGKLTSVTIPESVKTIGEESFRECKALNTIDIPSSVTNIGNYAFFYCSGLTSIIIPNSVTFIGGGAFKDCSSLTSVTIPNGVTSINGGAFQNCSSLTSVKIPNSVTSIGYGAYEGCSDLTSITIGSGVISIREKSFSQCPDLTDVYCYAERLTDNEWATDGLYTFSDAFEGSYIQYATLHVPNGCSAAYKAVAPWKNFKKIVEMVDAKVKLSKTKATIEKGKTLTLKATVTPTSLSDKSVTWKSSDTKVATVTSKGVVKGVKAGTATITCTSKATGAKATCKVTVGYVKLDQTDVTLLKGKTVTLAATVYPSSLTDKTVTWESSNTKIATVTSAGKVKGVKAGTATITCTSKATGLKATCTVNVVKGFVTLNKTEAYVQKGKTVTLKATVTPTSLSDKSVTWKSSNTKIATVSSAGKVKGVDYGTVTITCTSKSTGATATCKVTVGKVIIGVSEITLKRSRTAVLTASIYPLALSDKSVTWTSSNTAVVTVTAEGLIKGIKAGTATITCTSKATGLKGTCTVTVLQSKGSLTNDGDGIEMVTEINEIEKPAVIEPFDVYDLSGRKVLHQVTSLDGLPNGIYIVNGKKILKK